VLHIQLDIEPNGSHLSLGIWAVSLQREFHKKKKRKILQVMISRFEPRNDKSQKAFNFVNFLRKIQLLRILDSNLEQLSLLSLILILSALILWETNPVWIKARCLEKG
jgi:hypothetical protein